MLPRASARDHIDLRDRLLSGTSNYTMYAAFPQVWQAKAESEVVVYVRRPCQSGSIFPWFRSRVRFQKVSQCEWEGSVAALPTKHAMACGKATELGSAYIQREHIPSSCP